MKAWDIVSEILTNTAEKVKPGVTTGTLAVFVEHEIERLGALSYNKNYFPDWAASPFPDVMCISVNNEIAHGIPSLARTLEEGDIVTIDLGIVDKDGQCGDAAMCIPVGEISKQDETLLHYAKKVLYAGIEKVKAGVTIGELARAMERVAGERGFKINRVMCGHGIGKQMHQLPNVYHCTNANEYGTEAYKEYEKELAVELKAGDIICIEPAVTSGNDPYGEKMQNGWTWQTRDGKKSAQFEHMVKVLDDGYEILTHHIQPFVKPE